MKIHTTILVFLKIAVALLFLTGCSNNSLNPCDSGSHSPATISITPKPGSIPAGTSVTFSANISGDVSSAPTWLALAGGDYGNVDVGTLSAVDAAPSYSVTYTAPSTPPINSQGFAPQQGEVTFEATDVSCAPTTLITGAATFAITAPTVTVGLSPTTVSVGLGTTEQFYGYAVGNVNNTLTWQVEGVTGGSMSCGTITNINPVTTFNNGGLYTAPAIMPMTGSTVAITMVSQADPTKTQTAVITLH